MVKGINHVVWVGVLAALPCSLYADIVVEGDVGSQAPSNINIVGDNVIVDGEVINGGTTPVEGVDSGAFQPSDSGTGSGAGAGTDTSGGAANAGTGTNTSRNQTSLGDNKVEKLQLNNTMNFNDCHQYNVSPGMKVCILLGKKNVADDVCKPNKFITCVMSYDYKFNYWEPSELIEVSCRKGYSMLLPGGVGQIPEQQSCFSVGTGAGKRWFFDARVWAINGKDGAARAQAAGSKKREQAVACGANGPFGGLDQLEGYAKKFKMFEQGPASGPGQSWEAYISDYDKSWAVDSGGAASQQANQSQCSGTSVPNCWGPEQPLMGWVSHPHQPVAAALVGWRAHTKAQGKVSPALSGGYKINLDYPFIMRTSPFGKSMGLKSSSSGGGGSVGGTQGSRCFQPGDPGPWWYTDNQRSDTKPEQLPGIIQGLKDGDEGVGATLHTGVYIFTYWVKTSCELFAGVAGTNVQSAINDCKDKQHY